MATQGRRTRTAMLCLFGCAGAAQAQQVLTPPPAYNTTPPAVQEIQSEQIGTLPGMLSPLPTLTQLLQWGPVSVRPHVDYQFSYGTGIQSAPGQRQNSVIQTVSPGVLFGLGTHWTLDYTPILTFYSSSNLQDNLGHALVLTGGTAYEDWVFGFTQSVSLTSEPSAETGAQTDSQIFGTGLTGSYRFSGNVSVDMSVNQSFSDQAFTGQSQSTREWSTMEYLNYQLAPQLDVGIGAGFTYDNENTGPDMSSEQLQARVNWRATDKLSFSVHGGAEDRQFLSGGQASLISPVFGVSINYMPLQQTLLTLSADRTVAPSAFQSQIMTSTALNVALTQRFFKKFSLSVNGGYSKIDYSASATGLFVSRSDDYYTLTTRLGWQFWKRASASIFYTYSAESSSQNQFTFYSSQGGFELGYRF